jgi:hypothetical protein
MGHRDRPGPNRPSPHRTDRHQPVGNPVCRHELRFDGTPGRVDGQAGRGEPQGDLPCPAGSRARGRGSGESHRVPPRPAGRRLPLDTGRDPGHRPPPARACRRPSIGRRRPAPAPFRFSPATTRRTGAQDSSGRLHPRDRSAETLTISSERGTPPLRSRHPKRRLASSGRRFDSRGRAAIPGPVRSPHG